MKYFMQKYITIKPDHFHGEGYNVLVSGNGSQWSVVFSGTQSACKRIVKAFTREGSQYIDPEFSVEGFQMNKGHRYVETI